MKKLTTISAIAVLFMVAAIVTFTSCSSGSQDDKIKSLQAELDKYKAAEALTQQRLAMFDTLDYEYYSNQKWDMFKHNHADNIKVYYPDGHVTEGLYPNHIDMLTPMFVFAPDTKIKEHPVRFGSGDWTAVIGVMEGTFSQPMPIGNGKTIPPTGKKFKLSMTTLGHWGPDRKMIEEYLFWDNQAFIKQIGLAN